MQKSLKKHPFEAEVYNKDGNYTKHEAKNVNICLPVKICDKTQGMELTKIGTHQFKTEDKGYEKEFLHMSFQLAEIYEMMEHPKGPIKKNAHNIDTFYREYRQEILDTPDQLEKIYDKAQSQKGLIDSLSEKLWCLFNELDTEEKYLSDTFAPDNKGNYEENERWEVNMLGQFVESSNKTAPNT